jgi:hypothetical protein
VTEAAGSLVLELNDRPAMEQLQDIRASLPYQVNSPSRGQHIEHEDQTCDGTSNRATSWTVPHHAVTECCIESVN